MAAIHELSGTEIAAQYVSGALSPVDVVRACLERIAAWEPRLNALYRLNRDGTAVDHARVMAAARPMYGG